MHIGWWRSFRKRHQPASRPPADDPYQQYLEWISAGRPPLNAAMSVSDLGTASDDVPEDPPASTTPRART